MESRQEIQQMRVVELREFLRRHDIQIKNLARSDGTPGPPRKSELLAAALEVCQDYNSARLETQSPATPTSPVATNPFQTRRLSTAPEDHMTTPQRRTPSQLQQRARLSAPPEAQEEQAERKSTTRARRRSSNWVDPSLLAQLKAPTPRRSQREPAQAKAEADKKLRSSARPSASYPTTEPDVGLRNRFQRRRSTLVPDEPPPQPSAQIHRTSGPSIRQSSSTNQAENARTEPSRAGVGSTARPRRLLDVDEEYISEEDPDYEADQEYVDLNDSDDSDYEDGKRSVEIVDLTHDATAAKNGLDESFDDEIQPASGRGKRRQRNWTHQEDIPFDSDAHESDRAHLSDPSSALETEDEDDIVDFNEWRSKDIKDWLRAHDIKFNPAASKVELVGLARAIKVRMETMCDVDDKSDTEEKNERRQGISAPPEDDDVIFVSQRSRKLRRRRFGPRINKRFVCMATVFILGLALLFLWWFAIRSIRASKVTPFCDTDSISNYTDTGDLCRKCPRHGICVTGELECDSGYVQNGHTCVPDEKFNNLVTELVDHAYGELAKIHGRQLCGEERSRGLTYEDIEAMLEEHIYEKQEKDPSFFRSDNEFDRVKGTAVSKALNVLDDPDYREENNIYIDEESLYRTRNAKLPTSCRFRRFVMKHHFKIVTVVFILYITIYLRWKLFLYRRRKRNVRMGYKRSLELLRDQVSGYRNGEEDTAFLSDVILREESLGRATPYIIEIWKEVEDLLRTDARVLRKHQSVRGMPSYTYEYVGSRRSSGGRSPGGRSSSGSFFDGLSRRSSSFGSRASLDSLDLRSDSDFEMPQDDGLKSYFFGLIEGK